MNSLKIFINSVGNSLKCVICRTDIKNNTNIYQSEHSFSIVCSNCCQKFPIKDIEWMTKIFLAYGGYFAKLKDQNFSLERYLHDLTKDLRENEKVLDINELNLKFIHEILLHGITIQEYLKVLESYLK
ncbi:MAG: hypothetical protein ACFFDK_09805 [Promethearchaeota archaeon]